MLIHKYETERVNYNMLIAFEGIDGSGKTTQAELLAKNLEKNCFPVYYLSAEEKQKSVICVKLKELTHNPENDIMTSTTETFLYLASLSQRTEEFIRPALTEGKIVIVDRFTDSVFVLAHYGRRLEKQLVNQMIQLATNKLQSSLTILCDLPVEVAFLRKAKDNKPLSRKEKEGYELHKRLRSGFLSIASEDPLRFLVVDHLNLTIEQSQQKIWQKVHKELRFPC